MSVRDRPSWADAGSPFKFLDYFTEVDEASFAGRDREVQTALAGVLKAPSFVLYGGSGTGKTSLLLAGLFPRLRQQGLRPVYVRTLKDPLADLRRAIRGELGDELAEARETAELTDLLAELSSETPVVLVFDQFEEFFIRFQTRPELRDPFIATLGKIAADRALAVKLLFSLRQEFLGELDDFRQHLPQLLDNEYRLKPLTAFGARQAIASQLRTSRVPFERRFLTRVVDLLEDYNFDPTILQIVCQEVYRRAAKTNRAAPRLTAAAADAVGDVRRLFQRYLGEMAASLPGEAQLTVRAVLDVLIAGERTRRAATFETIHRECTRQDEAAVRLVLSSLVSYKLVREDKQGEEKWYELTHERLTVVVREWLELDERFRQLRTARQLIANMARGKDWRRDPELLLTAHHLENVVGPVAEHLPLTPAEIEYLVRSAIFRRSRDSGIYWIGRYGTEESRRLVLEMLASGDPTAVRGAARMARYVDDPEGELARACARKAALEENLEIAAEAYFSVLALTPGGEHKKLMRRAVAEVVEDTEKPTPRGRLYRPVRKWKLLGRVRKQAARRAMSEPYRGLKTRVMDSIAAALLWSFLIGQAIYLGGVWPTGNLELASRETLAQVRGWGVPAALLLAVVLAAALPAIVGRAFSRRRPTWSRIVLCSWFLPRNLTWLILLGVFAAGLTSTGETLLSSFFGCGTAVLWLLISATLLIVTAVLVMLNSTALRADAPEVEIWIWSLITSCGLPILAPFVLLFSPAYLFALVGTPEHAEPLVKIAMPSTVVAAAALSFLCFIFQLLLARGGLAPSRRPVAAHRRRRGRAVAVAAVAMNLLGWFGTGGYDTVPLLGPSREITEGSKQIEFRGVLGPGYPEVDYLRLVAGDPLLLRLRGKPGLPVHIEGLDLGEAQTGHVLALPGPRAVAGDEGSFWAWLRALSEELIVESRGPRIVHQLIVGPSVTFGRHSMLQPWNLSLEVLGGPLELAADWDYQLVALKRAEVAGPVRRRGTGRRPPKSLRYWSYSLGQSYLGQSQATPGAVEIVVFRNQPTAAETAFRGKIEIPASEPVQDPLSCNFVSGPVLNYPPESEESSRRTWIIPAGKWPEAEIVLRIPERNASSVVLVIGARLAR